MPAIKVDLASYNNNWYKPGSAIKRFIWYYINLLFFKSGIFPFYGIKTFLLKLFGAKIGKNVLIKPHVNIKYPWLLQLGNNIWIGENVWIDNLAEVKIGDNVCISQSALLLSGNHDYSVSTFDLMVKPIIIEDGVWVCAKAIICGGVICAQHSIISTASVLSTSTEAFGIYRGNPAVKIKDRVIQ
jgi:putative colanic acid biosynthesis acetyltransferase WcaF